MCRRDHLTRSSRPYHSYLLTCTLLRSSPTAFSVICITFPTTCGYLVLLQIWLYPDRERAFFFFLIDVSCLLLEIGVYYFSNLVLLHCRQILYYLNHQRSPVTSHSSTKTVINWQNSFDNLSLIISTSLINPFFFPVIYDKNVEGKAKQGESLCMIFRSCHRSVQGFPFRSN